MANSCLSAAGIAATAAGSLGGGWIIDHWAHLAEAGRTRPMGTFSDRTSMERILYAVFTHENRKQGTATFLVLA